ncbi:MAG: hypothetical protein WCV00_18875 [Verrucomicrobiia bacterium]|jgi:hypothetical protein
MTTEQIGLIGAAVLIVAVVVFLVIYGKVAAKRREEERRKMLVTDARLFLADLKESRALPIVQTKIILKPGEQAFYSEPSALYETRAVRHYQSGYTGFRVAKGIYVGGSQGRSVSTQEWSKIDDGFLTVTNKRLVFDGGGADRDVSVKKVVSVQAGEETIEVSVEGRQKSMIFDAANPLILATMIRICCQAEDASDLSKTTFDVTIKD